MYSRKSIEDNITKNLELCFAFREGDLAVKYSELVDGLGETCHLGETRLPPPRNTPPRVNLPPTTSYASMVVLLHPGFNLRDLCVNNILNTLVCGTILEKEIGAMEPPRNNMKRGGGRWLKWTTRARVWGYTRISPRIKLSVHNIRICGPCLRIREDTYPFAQMSRVVLVKSQPLVHELTSDAVFPFALP